MNILGIIAEYNPFHNGHLYHLLQSRQHCSFDGVICVMSGNFVQRGEPAIFDKWARAEMAISQGVDIVFELPVPYATHSAYWFARGGIETLFNTGLLTHLSFGVETSTPEKLHDTAQVLAKESKEFQRVLRFFLKKGLSFPRARHEALLNLTQDVEDISLPNNILALSYLQVICELDLQLKTIAVQRKGSSYHDVSCQLNNYPSATAIRDMLIKYYPYDINIYDDLGLSLLLPEEVNTVIKREILNCRGPVSGKTMDDFLLLLLRRSNTVQLRNIVDVAEGLENRILRKAISANDLQAFLAELKTKRYTYSRLKRLLIHILFDYTKDKESYLFDGPQYLRVLGISKNGRKIMRKIVSTTDLPIITKTAHIKHLLKSSEAARMFIDMDLLATDLYTLLYPGKTNRCGGQDYYKGPFIKE